MPPQRIRENTVHISGSDAHHLARVMRLKKGDEIIVFDGSAKEYHVVIEEIQEVEVLGKIIGVSASTKEAPIAVTLVQGIPKGDKMELIIQKATELGVHNIVPVLTERTVVKLEESKKAKRQERWQKIAQEASKQCKRATVPKISEIISLSQYLAQPTDIREGLVLWEEENSQGLKTYLKKQYGKDKLTVFIGPEGGFSPGEIKAMEQNGIRSVTLGQRILRTETAGLAAIAIILYELGDLG